MRRWNLDVNRCVRGRWPRQNREELANIPSIPRLDRAVSSCCSHGPPLSASKHSCTRIWRNIRKTSVQFKVKTTQERERERKSALFCSHSGRMPPCCPLPRDWRSMAPCSRQGVIGSCIPSMPTSLLVQRSSPPVTQVASIWSLTFCK